MFLVIDWYLWGAVKLLVSDSSETTRKVWTSIYWGLSIFTVGLLLVYNLTNIREAYPESRQFILFWIFAYFMSKLFGALFFLIGDIWRGFLWVWQKLSSGQAVAATGSGSGITRSEFVAKSALIASAVPIATMGFGIASGAHDYRIRHRRVVLPNLPKSFSGIKIAQLSDIHSGSFFNKTAVKGGVEMLMAEKPDLVFFTGDLVNNVAEEVKEYVPVFSKVKAPLGVYSTFGNHDYAEYTDLSEAGKQRSRNDLKRAHKEMGWDLLWDENRLITQGSDTLAVLGVQNWGTGRWPKYGNLAKAYKGTEEAPVKLLLSHDPTHWDGQVRPQFGDIDVTFSGHTHGFQFGVEIGNWRWSPAQYMYKQWADLYQEGNQYLYVNRGFGYLGYPGRVGILPEITIMELVSS